MSGPRLVLRRATDRAIAWISIGVALTSWVVAVRAIELGEPWLYLPAIVGAAMSTSGALRLWWLATDPTRRRQR